MKNDKKSNLKKEIEKSYLQALSELNPNKRVNEKLEHSVKKRIKMHKKWLDSDGKEGARFQAKNENLTGIDFSRKNLSKAEFKSCILDYCNFFNSNLSSGTEFWNCSIKKSYLINAQLGNTQFIDCDIEDTKFKGSVFKNVTLTGIYDLTSIPKLTDNDFSECKIINSTFNNFNLWGAIIEKISLTNVQFNQCDLSNTDFTKIKINSLINIYKSKCIYINLKGMNIEESSFVDCDLTNAEFEEVNAKKVNFSKSNLTRTNFRNSNLEKSRFNMTLGKNMKFYGADINNSEMRLSSFREANFLKCKLYNSDLAGSDLFSALLDNTTNRNFTNFSGCTWTNGKRCKAGSIAICYEEE